MEQMIEMLKQIQEISGVLIDALEQSEGGKDKGEQGEQGGPPKPQGGGEGGPPSQKMQEGRQAEPGAGAPPRPGS